jgi:hypothetical protein
MTEPGAYTATLLVNNKVLITRSTDNLRENHADIYDPTTGSFARTGDLVDYSPDRYPWGQIPGLYPSAVLLPNGKVLIAGGAEDVVISSTAELYDFATGAFAGTGAMAAAIGYWQATALLPDGKVLITGESPGRDGTAELYDPITGTFSAPFDSQSQEGHAATLLPDGTVLLSGGWVCCGHTIATAQIYHPTVLIGCPVLYSLAGDGKGPGAILHASTQQIVSSSNPVVAGEVLEIYGTGLSDGSLVPPQVAIGGRAAEVLWFGNAPGFPNLNQVNVRVPSGIVSGPNLPVRLTYLARPSNEVTVFTQ